MLTRQLIQLTVNCVPKLAALAKLFDATFGRKHEARCARNSLKKYRIDRIVIFYLEITLDSNFNFCTKRYMKNSECPDLFLK